MGNSQWAPQPGQLEKVTSRLVERHADEEICYTTCPLNGCWDACVLKTHIKNGETVAIETDNSIHQNRGREDEYVDFSEFEKGLYQKRACVRGRGLRADCYSPNRLLYPMKRVGPKGTREFVRITWDEALDTIAQKYLETREKYGPLSCWVDGMMGTSWDPWSRYLPGGGIACWGEDSYEPTNFADDIMYGSSAAVINSADGIAEAQTFFDTEAIVLFGIDTAINYTERVFYQLLGKERDIPVIVIDPRLSWTAQTMATQWIPIRPSTDCAMLMAMTYVVYEEDLVDHEFVEKMVEPKGVEVYRRYIMGEQRDELPKTPEWAEVICGVPAETIRELARLIATKKPCYMRMVWAAAKGIYGKDTTRAFNILQCLTGNIGKKGCAGNGTGTWHLQSKWMSFPFPVAFLGGDQGKYEDTICMEAERWHTAILNRVKLEAGEMTMDQYKESIGCSHNVEAPNIHFVMSISGARNLAAGWYGVNERLEALKICDFVAYSHYNMTNQTIPYCDIVLPMAHNALEGVFDVTSSTQFGIHPGINAGTQNWFIYGNNKVKPLGEARPNLWITKEIGKRMGLENFMVNIIDASPDEIDEATEKVCEASYNYWRDGHLEKDPDVKEWDEFVKEPFYRLPMDDYYVFMRKEYEQGIPLPTKSGKVEFFSDEIAECDMTVGSIGDSKRQIATNNIKAIPIWRESPEGYQSAKTKDYPLFMVTPHSFFRCHTSYEHSLWFRDEYRNGVWISPSDAKARRIKDGDKVRVRSEVGEACIPAYVTSRMVPGTCCMIFGRWYEPSGVKTDLMPEGVDMRGDCNLLISSNMYDDAQGACLNSGLVQIEKFETDLQLELVPDLVLGEEGLK